LGHRVAVFKQAGGRPDYNERVDAEVVGVAADTKLRELSDDPLDTVYLPLPLNPWRSAFLVVRAESDPAALTASVRRAVTAVDADIPVGSITTVAEIVDGRFAPRRFAMTLLGAFAAIALLLATIGVYGVIAFGVSQRTREIGIRVALGAARGALMRLFVAEGFALSVIGVALGAGAAVAGTRLLASMVYGVGVHDAATFAGVAVLLVLVAMLASWIPARRAARVDPLEALRAE
jgi:putative ABC transport system permease protein